MKCSVVVPTYRRAKLLERCLTALMYQRMPPEDFEVVVVDDGAEAAVQRLMARFAANHKIRLQYVRGRQRGPAAARTAGWRAASAEVIAFTDDDCIPHEHWLAEGLRALLDADGASGRVILPLPEIPTDYQRNAARLADAAFVTANCFYRRAALQKVGGFDEHFTIAWREDSDLHFRLLAAGGVCCEAPLAIVVHPIRPAPWGVSLLEQRKNLFNALLYKKHPQLYRQYVQSRPPWLHYAMLGSLAVSLGAAARGAESLFHAGLIVWLLAVSVFCARRLADTSKSLSHIAEMVVTSLLIPPAAIFWRLAGAVRYRVFFL
ncbi:MAG: glycosyltransferase [Bryobacteraceae bacterium]|nr:glycosyltransferase [Bryobacteraceae bacterium]